MRFVLQWVQQSIKNVTEDITNAAYNYASHEDICACFNGETSLAIQAPNGTQLEVPIPELMSAQTQVNLNLEPNSHFLKVDWQKK